MLCLVTMFFNKLKQNTNKVIYINKITISFKEPLLLLFFHEGKILHDDDDDDDDDDNHNNSFKIF